MLTENEDDGFLIDFDLSIRTSDIRASGAPSKTGTKVFMSIGSLQGEPHNSMHDMESIFWVLFWVCLHYEGRNGKGKAKPRIVSKYEKWNYESTETLADIKSGLVVEETRFAMATADFTTFCKPLIPCVQELRTHVFPNGKRRHRENKEIYSQIEGVLAKTKSNLQS